MPFLNTIWLSFQLFCVVCSPLRSDDAKVPPVAKSVDESFHKEAKVILVDAKTDYTVDLLDFPLHRELLVHLVVVNNTDTALNLNLAPSCGCTKLKDPDLQIPVSGSKDFYFTLAKLQAEQRLDISLSGTDKSTGKKFTVGISGIAVDEIRCVPGVLRVASTSTSKVDFDFSTRFEGIDIDAIDLVGANSKLVACDIRNGLQRVTVDPEGIWRDKQLFFVIHKKSGENTTVCVPVFHPDKVSIVARSFVLRQSSEEASLLTANFLLKGEGIENFRDSISVSFYSVQDSGKLLATGRISSTRSRTSDLIVVSIEVQKNSLETPGKYEMVLAGENKFGFWKDVVFVKVEGEKIE